MGKTFTDTSLHSNTNLKSYYHYFCHCILSVILNFAIQINVIITFERKSTIEILELRDVYWKIETKIDWKRRNRLKKSKEHPKPIRWHKTRNKTRSSSLSLRGTRCWGWAKNWRKGTKDMHGKWMTRKETASMMTAIRIIKRIGEVSFFQELLPLASLPPAFPELVGRRRYSTTGWQ